MSISSQELDNKDKTMIIVEEFDMLLTKTYCRNFIHALFLMGLLFPSAYCMGQTSTFDNSYRDSLYQYIREEGYATLSCHFVYKQGDSDILADLGKNNMELSRLDLFIRLALDHPELFIRRIRLSGYSSIEGSYLFNERLAYNRIDKLRKFVYIHYPDLYAYPLDMSWTPEDWKGFSHLARLFQIPEQEEVIAIIQRVPDFDKREVLFRKLNGGRAFRKMEEQIFPLLRRVEISFEFGTSPLRSDSLTKSILLNTTVDSLIVETGDPLIYNILEQDNPDFAYNQSLSDASTEQTKRIIRRSHLMCSPATWVIKTNMLQLAGILPDFKHTTFLPNLTLEYFITRHWSVETGALYSYWHYNGHKEFQGISGYRVEPRFWLSFPFGHFNMFLGPYARFGDYDIQRLENGVDTTNYTGDYWDAGISTGLTFRLLDSWGIEIGARAGYFNTNAILYTPEGDKKWFDSRRSYSKFKITDLNASLIYRFR